MFNSLALPYEPGDCPLMQKSRKFHNRSRITMTSYYEPFRLKLHEPLWSIWTFHLQQPKLQLNQTESHKHYYERGNNKILYTYRLRLDLWLEFNSHETTPFHTTCKHRGRIRYVFLAQTFKVNLQNWILPQ